MYSNNKLTAALFVICHFYICFSSPVTHQEVEHRAPRVSRAAANADTPQPLENPWSNTDWNSLADRDLQQADLVASSINRKLAKNVILFLGDGMGISTISVARLFQAQQRNLRQEATYLTWENFPHVGLSRTYCLDRMTPDSAATGTAYMCGIKANYFTIGVNGNVTYGNCTNIKYNKVRSIVKESIAKGKWTGLVTTTRVTHASPAAGYAHTPHRDWEAVVPSSAPNYQDCEDIAHQLVTDSENQQIRVILGGGRLMFLPKNATDPVTSEAGQRVDGQDLIEAWKDTRRRNGQKFAYVINNTELAAVDTDSTDYLMGLFSPMHMDFEVDRIRQSPISQPSLSEMTEKAIRILERSPTGYFLFVEGGKIDYGHHYNDAFKALNDTLAFSDAVRTAISMTNDSETLVVVTADHSHTMSFSGYSTFQKSVLDLSDADEQPLDGKPQLQINYANGPAYSIHRTVNGTDTGRKNLRGVDVLNPDFLQDAPVPMTLESHGGEDVGIFASGPWSHLFHGIHEQNYIARVMMYASCVGRDRGPHCANGVMSSSAVGASNYLRHVLASGASLVAIMSICSLPLF